MAISKTGFLNSITSKLGMAKPVTNKTVKTISRPKADNVKIKVSDKPNNDTVKVKPLTDVGSISYVGSEAETNKQKKESMDSAKKRFKGLKVVEFND